MSGVPSNPGKFAPASGIGPMPGPLGRAASFFYSVAVRRINRRYDSGRGVVTLDRPVISIGNLSVGGTGKSPMVAHVARVLQEAKHRPCIAMRGYRAASGATSDEADEHARSVPGIPIVAQADRVGGLLELFAMQGESEEPGSTCVVLDDGFQHRRIARQLDIVLVDVTRSPFDDRLLPAGWLREPVEGLSRAGFFVVTHAEAANAAGITALLRHLRDAHPRTPIAVCSHFWNGITTHSADATDVERLLPVEALRGKRLLAVCAIGNPEPFLLACRAAAGANLAGAIALRDHDPYAAATVDRIAREAAAGRVEFIITTEKDWSKLRRVAAEAWPCSVVRPRLSLRFESGEAELQAAVLAAANVVMPD